MLHEDVAISRDRRLVLPSALQSIEIDAFNGTSAQQIVIPSGVTSIASGAFANCDALAVIVIPASVTEIASDAFGEQMDAIIVCPEDSAIRAYANEHGFWSVGVP